jgi:hypothetical protein
MKADYTACLSIDLLWLKRELISQKEWSLLNKLVDILGAMQLIYNRGQ